LDLFQNHHKMDALPIITFAHLKIHLDIVSECKPKHTFTLTLPKQSFLFCS
jgi:hypothetical protein